MDCSVPGSPVHGIILARILEWVAISSFRHLSDPGIEPVSPVAPALSGEFFTTEPTWEAHHSLIPLWKLRFRQVR